MKKTLLSLTLLLSSYITNAATIESARMSLKKNTIDVDLSYSGGCKKHKFSLEINGCLESWSVQCEAKIKDSGSNDRCEAFIRETVSFPMKDYGLNDSYYERASLTLSADNTSQITISLP